MRKLILQCSLSPGDIVMLTAAVRDLHLNHPGKFATDVRTSAPEIWKHNPYLTTLDETDPEVEVVACQYPLINKSNKAPYHCLHGFARFLSDYLKIDIHLTAFKGAIYLSAAEKSWISQINELTGRELPFWIVAAGGKYDYTIKWWQTERFQAVVDHFRGRIQFVQVGDAGHNHPPLQGVLDLRGRTDLRQVIRLMYHAQGVLCPVTFLMHLAAAVETKEKPPRGRPCVVVAGGREPAHWEAYPHHQFIHTIGALPCCALGGCWRSRTLPLGDGDPRDRPGELCVDVTEGLPRCMAMISPEEVIRRIEVYFNGANARYLSPDELRASQRALRNQSVNPFDEILTPFNALAEAEKFIRNLPPYPDGFEGRGIVICAGGMKYFCMAWVCIQMLRRIDCSLPIQVWYLGEAEMDERMKAMLASLQVKCVDAEQIRQKHPFRMLVSWELKAYAILRCSFKEVLLLDADNMPLIDPEFLFQTREYKKFGALFWPDLGRLGKEAAIWKFCGVEYRDEPEFESGQIVVDKERCWRPLLLAAWYNEHSDFFYQHIHGDKDTFHLAFRKLGKDYAMPAKPIHWLQGIMCQHDFRGRRIFQHRNSYKWSLFGPNRPIPGFRHEKECFKYLSDLRKLWTRTNTMDIILIQQASGLHLKTLDLTNGWHSEYAARHRISYWAIRGTMQAERHPSWDKILLINRALEMGFEFVVWMDADTLIVDPQVDLRTGFREGCSIQMCSYPSPGTKKRPQYNPGVIFIRNTKTTRDFFQKLWPSQPGARGEALRTCMNQLGRKMPGAILPLSNSWNCSPSVNPCRDPVIRAWHGVGPHALGLIRATLALCRQS